MRVENMVSPRTGEKVANQFVISDGAHIVFQSYSSTIAQIDTINHIIIIGEDWNYSRTTGKYRNAFFAEYFSPLADAKAISKVMKEIDESPKNIATISYGRCDWKIIAG